MNRWEYTWIFVPTTNEGLSSAQSTQMNFASTEGINNLNNKLEQLGNAGWELIAIVPFERSIGIAPTHQWGLSGGGGGGGTGLTVWVFKRLKEEVQST